jgi:glycosyltransferase involved in cell wall biosynthesis
MSGQSREAGDIEELRILVISNLYPPAIEGGYEVECAAVVDHLRARHRVLVLTSTRGSTQRHDQGVVRRLPWPGPARARSLLAPVDAVRAAVTARRAMRRFKPDLVYVWNGATIPQAAIRVAETSGAPVAYRVCEHWFGQLYRSDRFTRHLLPGDRGLRAAWAALMRIVNRLPVLRLDLSRPVPAAVCWNSKALRRLSPAPPSVDVALERIVVPATRQGEAFVGLQRQPAEVPTIAFIGRLEPYKGLDVVYHALALLRDRHGIKARLVVAGSGDDHYEGRLRELAAELSIADAIEERGKLDTRGLRGVLAEAHVVAVPSVWEEPAPLVCVEAALARVPVVASRVGGIPEVLHDEDEALLFAPGDAEDCAVALARTLREPDETGPRVERAFTAAQQFRHPTYLERMDAFLDDALGALTAGRSAIR